MTEAATSDITLSDSRFRPVGGSAEPHLPFDGHRRARQILLGTAIGAGLMLSPATGNVQWAELVRLLPVERSSPVAGHQPSPEQRLARRAREALARMSSDQKALYEEVLAIRDGFGAPVDVNVLVREMREDAS